MSSPKTRYERLEVEIDGYIKYCRRWKNVWGTSYYALRTILIVLSAIVAAKFQFISAQSLPAISLAVAIGTALDTWLKSGVRFKGHYTYHDNFIALYTQLELTDAADAAAIEKVMDEFKKLIDEYAIAVLPT